MAIIEKEKMIKEDQTTPSNITQTVAEVILAQLASWGIKNMYGVAGDAILTFLEAIDKQNKINYFAVRHESAAAFMASAEGKATRRIGVSIGTSGPGLANMLNGIADAAADHIPMLVITGQVETKKVGTEAKQYVEQQQMIAPLAVYSATLIHPEATVEVFQRAIIEAVSKKGVAHVSVPKDMFSFNCSKTIRPPVGVLWNEKRQDLFHLDQTVMLLTNAQKPMILIGEGARNASEMITKMAETLQAGIIETLGAKGVVPYDHPQNIGGIGEGGTEESKQLLLQADCVLVVGANWWPEGFVPAQTKVIHIDISPTSIEAHPNVVYGLVGDASEVLNILQESVRQQQQVRGTQRMNWMTQIKMTKQTLSNRLDQERALSSFPISPQKLMAALDGSVEADAIMVVDTGDHTIWFNRLFRAQQQEVLYSGKWRTMGFGLPAAISTKLAYPEKQVIAIIGDGCFAMTMMELATAVSYQVPIIIIVVHNQSLAMEKHKMIKEGIQPTAVNLVNPDFAALAQSFGVKGIKVEEESELVPALQEAYAANGPVLLDVLTADIMP
jgi:pyruvate oxidase